MTLRTRLRLAFLAVVIVPVVAFAFVVRRTMSERTTEQYQRRVDALVAVIEDDLALRGAEVRERLRALAILAGDDNRLRAAAVSGLESERPYLLDYAGKALHLAGLAMLQMQNERGRIISSGHFRNEYDRLEPGLPGLLTRAPGGAALLEARSPEGPFLALAAVDSVRISGVKFSLVGGVSVERSFLTQLARGTELAVTLSYPGGSLSSTVSGPQSDADPAPDSTEAARAEVVAELAVPFVDAERSALLDARIYVSHPLDELRALQSAIDRWFLVAVAVTAGVAFLLATWLASRISRPLAELAHKTSRIDLDRLGIDFSSSRKDEVGSLTRLLGSMTERLRGSAARLKEAERRATIGELARQVNHDIKNGLTPIRNVLRHLAQVARDEPDRLPEVFAERQGTVDTSIAYLENLASNYARLYPRMERRACDVNDVVRQVAASIGGRPGVRLETDLADTPAAVHADPVALRRIVENLADNAVDSLGPDGGSVRLASELAGDAAGDGTVRISVADTGRGMNADQQAKIFDDFYTTKDRGTGLGLSIVRRLVLDLDGTIRVESEPGQGSRFVVELPAAAGTSDERSAGGEDTA